MAIVDETVERVAIEMITVRRIRRPVGIGVVRRDDRETRAGFCDAMQFRDERHHVRHMLDDVIRDDQVKFVICSREDYDWSVSKLIEYRLAERAGEVLFSPSHHQVSARALADWIVADNLPVRLQLQLHKILWNDEPGH